MKYLFLALNFDLTSALTHKNYLNFTLALPGLHVSDRIRSHIAVLRKTSPATVSWAIVAEWLDASIRYCQSLLTSPDRSQVRFIRFSILPLLASSRLEVALQVNRKFLCCLQTRLVKIT